MYNIIILGIIAFFELSGAILYGTATDDGMQSLVGICLVGIPPILYVLSVCVMAVLKNV